MKVLLFLVAFFSMSCAHYSEKRVPSADVIERQINFDEHHEHGLMYW